MKIHAGLKKTTQPQKYTLHIDMQRQPVATETTKHGIYNAARDFVNEKQLQQFTIIDCKNNRVVANYVQ